MRSRNGKSFVAGTLIGTLGGLIGLGGAEFRLPVLVGVFKLSTLEAVILNKAVSLVVVAAALVFRANAIPFDRLTDHLDVALNLLAGSLVGAWWAAGHALTMPRAWLNRIIMVLLAGLSLVMLSESLIGLHDGGGAIVDAGPLRLVAGLAAGLGIGVVAALLGVAGGELLIPAIVLLYGLDIKLAGSLSLVVSLPTMIVGFARYTRSDAVHILRREQSLFRWMVAGSILGAALGGLLLGVVPTDMLMTLLGVILLVSAIKIFRHAH
ncbi:sulfite exporter TauE/SafE family protein [Azospirillum halopraeferens]|uniref:sulfite exporter TauE/SafE family protein n=1 Tax=Azospirillum halopraeferens TaxID=34010 RepID=UPI000556E6CD|nr:sulfite exporter TauE/SafE family protein [Azospirillum halopraeferens]